MTKPWTVVLAWILAGGNQSPRGGLKNDLLEVKKKKRKVQLCVEYKKPLTNLAKLGGRPNVQKMHLTLRIVGIQFYSYYL